MALIFLIVLLFLVLVGLPVALSLGATAVVVMLGTGQALEIIPARIFATLDKFLMLAVPFFILAGELMTSSGILERILNLTRVITGRIRGGLLHINVLMSMLFGGINGAAVADASAIGSMLIPPTIKEYGHPEFAAAVTANSSIVGPIIPPSVPMLVYAMVATNVSVGALFLAGVIPGIILGLGMLLIVHLVACNKKYPRLSGSFTGIEKLAVIKKSFAAIMLPVIMVGGIVGGIVTPTESGCIAVLYALLVGLFFTKELNFKKIYDAFVRTAVVCGVIFLVIAMAGISSWWLSMHQVPLLLSDLIKGFANSQGFFLLLVLIIYLLVGMFIEPSAGMIMLVPVLLPLAMNYGVNPIQFGLTTCLGLLLGNVTPPVGMCLFITSEISKAPVIKVFMASIPLLILNCAVLILITFFPGLYLWVPRLFGYDIN